MKCFNYHKKNKKKCNKKSCRYWVHYNDCQNCSIICSSKRKFTLEEIGNMFNVTRMRICQIEKNAIKKIKDKIYSTLS